MSKKVNQTLTGAMAAMMATGVVATPVMAATTDVDALYKAAYTATQKALTEKTQAAVNEARTAIKALPAKLDWAIGEFSKQVDSVQHPILKNIVDAIKLAEKTPTQANINAARKAIPADLVPAFKNSYSSAVDKIQQGLQAKVVEAVKKAETSRKAEDVEAAKVLIADVATADSQALKDWAKAMQTKVEAVKLYDLTITSAKVTTGGVEVEFEALKDALEKATVEVVDNKGNVVTVEAKTVLIEGETYANFSFETALKTRPSGVWTINGFKVDLDPINLVADVIAATDKDDLYDVLVDSGLVKNVKEAYAQEYLDSVDRADVETLKDVQKLIDDVNAAKAEGKDIAYVVSLATNGTTTQFKNALLALDLEGVNVEWITDYKTEVKTSKPDTLAKLQTLITNKNNLVVKAEIADAKLKNDDGKFDKDLINAAIELVNNYYVVDEEDETEVKEKAGYISALKVKYAVATVNGANTQASMKVALKALETTVADENTFSYEVLVNENVMSNVVKANTGALTDVDGVKALLLKGQTNAIEAAVGTIAAKATIVNDAETAKAGSATTAQKTALVDAYNELAKVSAKVDKLGSEKALDAKLINKDLVVKYAAKAKDYVAKTTKVSQIITDLENENKNIVASSLAPSNVAVDTPDALLKALKDIGVNNLVDENKEEYSEDIKVVVDTVDSNKVKDKVGGTEWTKDLLQKKVNSINSLVTLVNSSDITVVRDNLTNIAVYDGDLEDYLNAASSVKLDISELLVKAIANKKAGNNTATVKITDAITNLETLKTAVGEVEAIRTTTLMDKLDVSKPSDLVLSDVVSALDVISTDFAKLGTVEKYAVAEAFNEARSTYVSNDVTYLSKLGNFTAVRTLLATVIK